MTGIDSRWTTDAAHDPPPGLPGPECSFEEDASAHLLGCLDENEDERVRAHLPLCRTCQDYLASMSSVLRLLEAAACRFPAPGGPADATPSG
jgi:hypothetical protein